MHKNVKNQILRLIKFVAELKKGNYPNAQSFAKKLKNLEYRENLNLACSSRTIMRDIEYLKKEFNAPIEYDAVNNGYYLFCDWDFMGPLQNKDTLVSTLLGARIAEQILPEPIKQSVSEAAETAIALSESDDFFDADYLNALIVASGSTVSISPEVFKTIFDAWKSYKTIKISYKKSSGSNSNRVFEPHILAEHNSIWYIKGYEINENDERLEKISIFAIHRIIKVSKLDKSFTLNKKIAEDINTQGLFDYPKIKNIKVWCSNKISSYLKEQAISKKFTIKQNADDSIIVTFPESYEYEITRWILAEGANVKVLSPDFLKNKIIKSAKDILDLYKI